ncbi:MAG: hypothetical protein EZS28_030994 [Streblomastix strix]|uniref:Uncharacterized protein n=1 Tax=Streblomastix strix TaxID=222440 RepID=A0A5J4UTJ4_9EUKA|nr:MAG: hypothetical protein EZS28_030994 [Streblomastix strix]
MSSRDQLSYSQEDQAEGDDDKLFSDIEDAVSEFGSTTLSRLRGMGLQNSRLLGEYQELKRTKVMSDTELRKENEELAERLVGRDEALRVYKAEVIKLQRIVAEQDN